MKCTRVCAPKQLNNSSPKKILMEPDFPCLADEIAYPSPDVNIKVTAFTESKQSYFNKGPPLVLIV